MLPALLVAADFIADPRADRTAALALDSDPDSKNAYYPGHIPTTPLDVQ